MLMTTWKFDNHTAYKFFHTFLSAHQYNLINLALGGLGQNFQNLMDVAISLVILL